MLQFDLMPPDCEPIKLLDADIQLWQALYPADKSTAMLHNLLEDIPWQQECIRIAGMWRQVPRLSAWFGDDGANYIYSGIEHKPLAWTPLLHEIKKRIEQVSGYRFNSALCNLYRNGQDSVAWHADDEVELGINPVIASVSFGATRHFKLKHKTEKIKHTIDLTSGSLLIMMGAMQHHWLHQIPKQQHITEPRVNITFRSIKNK